ncbi:hypothetical protein [Micromonospora sp. NPDC001898]|uniref:hypothetical protein n=1 Tax=Micromonospora sp. NPDC001898 TaxID=3364221 RepID=UPI00367E3A5D
MIHHVLLACPPGSEAAHGNRLEFVAPLRPAAGPPEWVVPAARGRGTPAARVGFEART